MQLSKCRDATNRLLSCISVFTYIYGAVRGPYFLSFVVIFHLKLYLLCVNNAEKMQKNNRGIKYIGILRAIVMVLSVDFGW